MSKEVNGAALGKFAEAVNTGNYDLFDEVVSPDCVDHDPAPNQAAGPAGYRALFSEMRAAFPDMQVGVEALVQDDDNIAFAYTFTGTHQGTLMGIEPTGRAVRFRGMQISRFRDGLMTERWGSSDQLGMLQQIGAKGLPA